MKTTDSQMYEGIDDNGLYDFTQDFHKFLSAVNTMGGRYGIGSYILFLRGSKNSKISRFHNNVLHGSGKDKQEDWWKGVGKINYLCIVFIELYLNFFYS